jgi:hypothetical protein
MYRIKLQSGEESEFSSFEELCFGVVSGIIGSDDEIYHAKASKWLPIESHPDYKRAAAQAPPPTPAMVSPSSVSPSGVADGDETPEDDAGQDLMTLLDLEEVAASHPGELQELAPVPQADPEAETAELEPIEAQEPEAPETNGHAAQDYPEADELDESAADAPDSTEFEVRGPADEMAAMYQSDDSHEAESSDDEQPAEEMATAELGVTKDMELDGDDEAAAAHASDTNDAEPEEAESEADDVDLVTADGSRDMDYVAAEDQDDDADEVDDYEEAIEDVEPVAESAPPATLEVQGEVIEEAADLEEDDTDEDVTSEAEPVEQVDNDDDMDDEDALLGGPVVELDASMEDQLSDFEAADEPESEELVVAAEVADPIDAFQPDMDDDLFDDAFDPELELDKVRRFPIVPVAIAAGAVVMAVLGWMLMGPSASNEPVAVPDNPAPATTPAVDPAPAAVPRTSAGLKPEPPTPDNSTAAMQRRYDEAYSNARSRLAADLRRAGFAAVFAQGNFASVDAMITARAAIAGASLAVTVYAGREQGIRDDFPDADPTGKESRMHREMAEDLLAVSRRIYDLLLANGEAFAIRTGGMTITDPAVESQYAGLLGEVNRLMALAATADEEQAVTIRRVASAVGATRPPALAELVPPPSLPADL